MRHRIGNGITGLGNSTKCLLPNTWSDNEYLNEVVKLMFDDALKLTPLDEYGGFDFKVELNDNILKISFGYEPTYQYDKLLIYTISNNKDNCKIIEGVAEGCYGSKIKTTKECDYKSDIEFKELIDKWHNKIINAIN